MIWVIFCYGVLFCSHANWKIWISKPWNTIEYANSLNEFLEFEFGHANGVGIKSMCSKCGFKKWQTRDVVQEHVTCTTFPQNYHTWYKTVKD